MLALQKAFKVGAENEIKNWIANSNEPDMRDDHDFTPLMFASKYGRHTFIPDILSKTHDVQAQNSVGDTALHIACQEGQFEAVQELVKNGAKVNVANDHGNTPLHYAAFWNWPDIAMFLVQNGAYITVKNQYDKSPIEFARPSLTSQLLDEAKKLGADLANNPKLKIRSVDEVEAATKAKYVAKNRQQFVDINLANVIWEEILWRTDTCDVLHARVKGVQALVKRFNKKSDTTAVAKVKEEITRLQKVQNPHLMAVLGACYDLKAPTAVYECVRCTSLQEKLHDMQAVLQVKEILTWAYDISDAMRALHQADLYHMNLKSKNIMIIDDKRVQVADYGFYNTILGDYGEQSDKLIDAEYLAPEILRNSYSIAPDKTDVYSYGILLYEMITRQYPYDETNSMFIGLKVVLEGRRPSIPNYVPQHLSQLMQICWDESVQKRPSFVDICKVMEKIVEIEQ